MDIPNTVVGLVIGKGGDSIKRIQALSGARVQIAPGTFLTIEKEKGCGRAPTSFFACCFSFYLIRLHRIY